MTGLPDFEFTWRIQSVGETETDLQYQLVKEYVRTCQDPTSTARTVANEIHVQSKFITEMKEGERKRGRARRRARKVIPIGMAKRRIEVWESITS